MATPPDDAPLRVRHREYRDDGADRSRIRDLLIAIHPVAPPAWAWDIRRWDGWCFHREDPRITGARAASIRLWEASDGRLVGVAHPEGDGDAYLEVHPGVRHLEPAMLAWAEDHLAQRADDGSRTLDVVAWDHDDLRVELLQARGYRRESGAIHARRRSLAADADTEPGPDARAFPEGYRWRATAEATLEVDAGGMAALLNAAFGRTMHTAAEVRTFMTASPSFRHDLALVVEAPDGTFAAHVGCTLDPVNAYGIVEPVATHPAHRRLGLARALLLEGVRRLARLGATTVGLETGSDPAANRLYEACGFTDVVVGHTWRRRWQAPSG